MNLHYTWSHLITSSVFFVVYSLSHVQLFGDPMDCSPPDSSVLGISQAKMLEWVPISFSRGSSWPRDRTPAPRLSRQVLYHWATREAPFVLRKAKTLAVNSSTTFNVIFYWHPAHRSKINSNFILQFKCFLFSQFYPATNDSAIRIKLSFKKWLMNTCVTQSSKSRIHPAFLCQPYCISSS